jgi:hypothetical protein
MRPGASPSSIARGARSSDAPGGARPTGPPRSSRLRTGLA